MQRLDFARPSLSRAVPVIVVVVAAGLSARFADAQNQPLLPGVSPIHVGAHPGQPAAGPAQPIAPFRLTPQEEAELDRLLLAWERRSQNVKTFKCNFTRWEYDRVFGPANAHKAESAGELKFAAPDKGLFHVKSTKLWSPKTGTHEAVADEQAEMWICDGKSVYEYNPAKKHVIERKLPPELQGKAISNGPLPFLFGADAQKLKFRYFLRIVTPPEAKEEVWLEAHPRFRQDAANFKTATLILSTKTLLPFALQIVDPNDKNRTAYQFHEIAENRRGFFEGDFSVPRVPFGWKKVVEDAQGVPAGPPRPAQQQAQQAPSGTRRN